VVKRCPCPRTSSSARARAWGRLDAGLSVAAFVGDPRTHFVPVQHAMAENDVMSERLGRTGSGLFAAPLPGVPEGEGRFLGDARFG